MALVLPTATAINRRQHPALEGWQPRWPVRPAYWAGRGNTGHCFYLLKAAAIFCESSMMSNSVSNPSFTTKQCIASESKLSALRCTLT